MRFPCLKIEGGLLTGDLIDQIYDGTAPGQNPQDFGVSGRLENEIAAAWQEAMEHWMAFLHRLERIPESDLVTTVTRDQWVIPILSLLGYELVYTPRAVQVEGKTYAISHRAGAGDEAVPVHVVGCRQSLDRRPEIGRPRLAPHSLVQEYLNRTEHLWGVVSNGFTLRLLRATPHLARPAYAEFDLYQMMEGRNFADFTLFYRLVHRSRLPQDTIAASSCWLEKYYDQTIKQGGRVRDHLRDSVEKAIRILGNGFLQHPANETLRLKITNGSLTANVYYQQLLRLIYRILFLFVAEERGLLTQNEIYRANYSVARLRRLCESRRFYTEHCDLWESLKITFRLMEKEQLGSCLGLPALNGPLFEATATVDLNDLQLANRVFLEAFWYISMYRENERFPLRRVNYAALDVEELGSVYEGLLDFHPQFLPAGNPREFKLIPGTERKTTGSYYTPRELVEELVESALIPVMQDKLVAAATPAEKEMVILSFKVCDPACGSGHFLLAAARRLGMELARLRTGADEPAPEEVRTAIRDVICHCLYGVDKNPMAVELCKVALWIEGHAPGKPLTFLDHHIRCGDSLVGVFSLSVLEDGIPGAAFVAVADDEKPIVRSLRRRNQNGIANRNQGRLTHLLRETDTAVTRFVITRQELATIPDDTPEQVRRKTAMLAGLMAEGDIWEQYATACHLWTAAFFTRFTQSADLAGEVPTSEDLFDFFAGVRNEPLLRAAQELAKKHRFFHWPLEFPEVFEQGGFDVVLCNPPWEKIKLQEEEFFAQRDHEIAMASNKAARQRLMRQLPVTNHALWEEYLDAKHAADALSKFLRGSGRFPLTARGDINTYSVFAELFSQLLRPEGRAGVVLPTGIATDDTNKHFFVHLVETGRLVSLYDFENREGIFPAVDSRYKFCLITLRGRKEETPAHFAFFLTRVEHLRDERRVFTLDAKDFALLNPNTRTCPVFRTKADAELTKKIYQRVPVLVDECTGKNPWGIRFMRMFDMSNDSHLFCTTEDLEHQGYRLARGIDVGRLDGLCFVRDDEVWLPLYEAKMIWQFDHRFGTYEGVSPSTTSTHWPTPSSESLSDFGYFVMPESWVKKEKVEARLGTWEHGWLLGFRNVTNTTNERTAIFTILPPVGVGNSVPLVLPNQVRALLVSVFVGNLGAIVFDYAVRLKIGGTNMNFFYVKQFPVLHPNDYSEADLFFIVPRVLELVYTAWDLAGFAQEVWQECPRELRKEIVSRWEKCCGSATDEVHPDAEMLIPFCWDAERRAQARAELDAYYARLYGLTRDELRYILDPKDVFGPDFPGETFRVLKEKEERQYGEYRTRHLILEAWDRLFGRS